MKGGRNLGTRTAKCHCFSWTHRLLWTSFHWSTTGAREVKRLICINSLEIKKHQ